MGTSNVINLAAARRRQLRRLRESCLREYALDKCVQMYQGGNWEGFAYWHAIYLRERRRLASTSIDAR